MNATDLQALRVLAPLEAKNLVNHQFLNEWYISEIGYALEFDFVPFFVMGGCIS